MEGQFVASQGVNPYDGKKLKAFEDFVSKELVRVASSDAPA